MKRVLLYDIAADRTGAVTILEQYYNRYSGDASCLTYVITSVLDFPENEHVKVIKLPWTKRSKLHRLYCDHVYIKKLIKKYNISEVINLQNVALVGINIPQTVYLHNAIPITDIKFSFIKERQLWLFKNVISKMILRNLKYADKVIVQATWIKNILSKEYGIPESLVEVERVKHTASGPFERIITDKTMFFYPANLYSYKNHRCIIEACKRLKDHGFSNFEVVFTIDPIREGREMERQIKEEKLPIKLVGLLNRTQMGEYYRKSVLVFPSYLETVGLPLVEAQAFSSVIISVDLPYARETIGNYDNVRWFDFKDSNSLYKEMKDLI